MQVIFMTSNNLVSANSVFVEKSKEFDMQYFFPKDILKFNVNYRSFKDLLFFNIDSKLEANTFSSNIIDGNNHFYFNKLVFFIYNQNDINRYFRNIVHKFNRKGSLTDIFIYDSFSKTSTASVGSVTKSVFEVKSFKVKQINDFFIAFRNNVNSGFVSGDPIYFSSSNLLNYIKNIS